MRADLHIHTSRSPDSLLAPAALVKRCVVKGLNCVAVTDHNSIQGALDVRRLAPFTVIIGEEIKTSQGEVIGLFLQEEIPRGLGPRDTARRVHDQGGLVQLPHPFDQFRRSVISRRGREELQGMVDIVEVFNARNTLQSANHRARDLAREWGALEAAVTDAHTAFEVGRTSMILPDFDGTPDGFKDALRKARLVMHPVSPLIHTATRATKIWKRIQSTGPVSSVSRRSI